MAPRFLRSSERLFNVTFLVSCSDYNRRGVVKKCRTQVLESNGGPLTKIQARITRNRFDEEDPRRSDQGTKCGLTKRTKKRGGQVRERLHSENLTTTTATG
ncbi:hypothetical protein RUM44_001139 [Polyplax serrata]|uniref:Uncharacterized protein n=1 Tax=Polyplax serrata TaxID=468196 RepID=A0ABR1B6R2_POLSC